MSSVEERSATHEAHLSGLRAQRAALDAKANRISLFRLVSFLGAACALFAGVIQGIAWALLVGIVLGVGFIVGVVLHARVLSRCHALHVRIGVHERYLKRIGDRWTDLPSDGRKHVAPEHPYASDIDLVGPGSLFQRIDVSQTREGEAALARALCAPAPAALIAERQAAVRELASKASVREEFEAVGALRQRGGEKLDYAPFLALLEHPPVFGPRAWLKPLMLGLLTITGACFVLWQLGMLDGRVLWLSLLAQGFLLWKLREPVHRAIDLLTARVGFAEAYEGMLRLIEQEAWQSPHLVALRKRLDVQGQSPSKHMARLARYEGYAQLRTQGPVYLVVNVVALWDLFCLERVERFVAEVGPHCEDWFRAVGELEMLCSLAALHHVDPGTTFPVLVAPDEGLSAEQLAHPLLPARARVPNDLRGLRPGCALIITGSNMAGKSTLLRAVGLNVALALAGGPVCARDLRLPEVRLRASMRIDDSLQRGASYFHAELSRLRTVVDELGREPPVLFLLDELLRGTNARARHQGARAVLLHLLARHAMGLVATHDVALSELEGELPGRVANLHFTDVFEHGEMRFDYKLREGVVKTSNALRLLAMAGIEVQVDDVVG